MKVQLSSGQLLVVLGVTAVLAAVCLSVVAAVRYHLQLRAREKEQAAERLERGMRIAERLLRGESATLAEWRQVFPNACAQCGFRLVEYSTWTEGYATYNTVSEVVAHHCNVLCRRCGKSSSWDLGPSETPPGSWNGFYARYVTNEQAVSIPELPWPVQAEETR